MLLFMSMLTDYPLPAQQRNCEIDERRITFGYYIPSDLFLFNFSIKIIFKIKFKKDPRKSS